MFVGHFTVALASKRAAPRTSLGMLLLAAMWADALYTVLLLAGIEHARIDPSLGRYLPVDLYYLPWSHSLVMLFVWAILLGGLYYCFRGYKAGAIWVAVGVLSHWPLDWLMHRTDMPLAPGLALRYGLGLYNFPVWTLLIEGVWFATGIWIYSTTTRPRDRVGFWAWWGFVVFFSLMFLISFFGPVPPNARAMGLANLSIFPVFLWAAWLDRHRTIP
jgi:hypothetical protein